MTHKSPEGRKGRERRVALVTGASRGIGRACAVCLAGQGFDLALLARTVDEGDRLAVNQSPTIHEMDTRPIPGTLRDTAALVEAAGARALIVKADLLDRASVGAGVANVLDTCGRVDVVVNNARFTGPGHMDGLLDTPREYLDKTMEANFVAPVTICQMVLPGMIRRGFGRIVNISSRAAYESPSANPGEGGWGFAYGASKAALLRLAGSVNVELDQYGVRAFNVDPGLIASERVLMQTAAFGIQVEKGDSPDLVGAAVAWLVSSPTAESRFPDAFVRVQDLRRELELLAPTPLSGDVPR